MAKARGRKTSKKTTDKPVDTDEPVDDGDPGNDTDEQSHANAAALAFARLHVWQVQVVRDILVVAAVIAVFWAGYALRAVTVPLLVALLLAYLFEPIVERWCSRRQMKRPVAVGALVGIACLAVLVITAAILPLAIVQSAQLFNDVRDGRTRDRIASLERWVPETLTEQFRQLVDTLPGPLSMDQSPDMPPDNSPDNSPDKSPDEPSATGPADHTSGDPAATTQGDAPGPGGGVVTRAEIETIVETMLTEQFAGKASAPKTTSREPPDWKSLVERVKDSAAAVFGVVGAIVQFGLLCFLIPFYFFFFSVSYPAVVRFGRDLLPKKNRTQTIRLLREMDRVIAAFVRGRIVISLIMGVMLAIGWMICGVPYAIVLGLIVGVFCAVPYLGVIGIPLAVGVLFIDRFPGESEYWWVWVLVGPTAVFAIVQLVEGYVLTPLIAGKATNLDPVTILVAVLAGGSVMGVYGMLLAIPLAACGKILFVEVLLPNIRAWARGEAADPLPIDR